MFLLPAPPTSARSARTLYIVMTSEIRDNRVRTDLVCSLRCGQFYTSLLLWWFTGKCGFLFTCNTASVVIVSSSMIYSYKCVQYFIIIIIPAVFKMIKHVLSFFGCSRELCLILKLQKSFVEETFSTYFLLAWTLVDNECIFIFGWAMPLI